MIPTLSQVCTLNSPFEADVRDFAAGRCAAIEFWMTKLEAYLEKTSPAAVRKLLDASGIVAPVASYQGGILDSTGDRRREAWELFRSRLAICQELSVPTLVVAADIQEKLDTGVLRRVTDSLAEAAVLADQYDVRVALEFQAGATFVNNVQTTVALIEQVNHTHLGICLDLFHYWNGPSKFEDLQLISREKLFHVQLSDLADVPRELARDAQRILPGEGDLPVSSIVGWLRAMGYDGPVSVELMNPLLWQVPALQFGEIGVTALRQVLGLAGGAA
ncbi:MAG: sugar phosphate isomerase/epimerase [Planctomycetales bacterium]|nr:sugar phosphate isomerase/epimerase [Planctomycetales bacterium]